MGIVRIDGKTAILCAADFRDEIENLLEVDLAEAFRVSSGGSIDGLIIEAETVSPN